MAGHSSLIDKPQVLMRDPVSKIQLRRRRDGNSDIAQQVKAPTTKFHDLSLTPGLIRGRQGELTAADYLLTHAHLHMCAIACMYSLSSLSLSLLKQIRTRVMA